MQTSIPETITPESPVRDSMFRSTTLVDQCTERVPRCDLVGSAKVVLSSNVVYFIHRDFKGSMIDSAMVTLVAACFSNEPPYPWFPSSGIRALELRASHFNLSSDSKSSLSQEGSILISYPSEGETAHYELYVVPIGVLHVVLLIFG